MFIFTREMKKSIFIFVASIILNACSTIIIRPFYIIENAEIRTDSFHIPENYNLIYYEKVNKFDNKCNNPVQVCRQVDNLLGKPKKNANWPDYMYNTKLINDSVWEIKVDYVTRDTKKGTLYGGGALLYVRKSDGEILYLTKFK